MGPCVCDVPHAKEETHLTYDLQAPPQVLLPHAHLTHSSEEVSVCGIVTLLQHVDSVKVSKDGMPNHRKELTH